MKRPNCIIAFLILLFSTNLFAQLSDKWVVVPLDTGSAGEPNANNLIFFPHPAISNSAKNFQQSPSSLTYNYGQMLDVWDLAGAPGFPTTSPVKNTRDNARAMLTDPLGLCYENLLTTFTCSEGAVYLNALGWQQLVADLRNYFPDEARMSGLAPEVQDITLAGDPDLSPYDRFGLSSVVSGRSPPAICYNIVQFGDWMACPVFGRIHLVGSATPGGMLPVAVQSPIIIYRVDITDHRYHLAGYLANPDRATVDDFGAASPDIGLLTGEQQLFPVTIAAFPSSSGAAGGGWGSLAVINTATETFKTCRYFMDKMDAAGRGYFFPWGLHCAYGLRWEKQRGGWSFPFREIWDSPERLLAAPKIYDLAAGNDAGHPVLFAPSNEKAPNGKFYLLKYYDQDYPTIDLLPDAPSARGKKLAIPKLIEAEPPAGDRNFGPFKVAVYDVNQDGYSDFVLTWKNIHDELADPTHNIWKSSYSPYISLFLSHKDESGINYHQSDLQIFKPNSSAIDPDAQLAAVAFGQQQGQNYLAVGNNKRICSADGNCQAFVTLFPVGGGIVDSLNLKTIQVSFKSGNATTPGVGALTTDPKSGSVASILRNPFIPAPESCDPEQGVYGAGWFGTTTNASGDTIDPLDYNHSGVPNRCKCLAITDRDPAIGPDADGDELIDVDGCDDCRSGSNADDEVDASGRVGDGVLDGCDNCAPSRCVNRPVDGMVCINHDQSDRDHDGWGDTCDACPDAPGLWNKGIYINAGPDRTYYTCLSCANSYLKPDGTYSPVIVGLGCDVAITAPPLSSACNRSLDADCDGVPDERDNCVFVYNPPLPLCGTPGQNSACGTVGGTPAINPSGQTDSDGDGSGDACDCSTADHWDDCDGDGVPNRFDHFPFDPRRTALDKDENFRFAKFQPPDTVYDPQPHVIASRKDLRLADGLIINPLGGGRLNPADLLPDLGNVSVVAPPPVCDFHSGAWPGPVPCDYMGSDSREVTVILPAKVSPPPSPPPPPPPGEQPQGGISATQHCIARVGRKDPNTAAIFPELAQKIIEANNRAHAITGIPDYDIFVGADGGIMHIECALVGGAFGGVSKDASADLSGGVGAYAVLQTSGLPPVSYGRRPDASLLIQPSHALLLAPLSPSAPSVDHAVEGASPSASAPLSLPNLALALPPHTAVGQMPSDGVQMGILRENLNGNMVVKILTSQSNLPSEGAELPVNDVQSLFVLDYKTYPEPSTDKPVEERAYSIDQILAELTQKVADWKRRGKPITPEIYQGLANWEPAMHPEFLLVQNTVPAAVSEINKSLSADETPLPDGGISQAHLPAYIVPTQMELGGGGCSCRLSNEPLSLAGILYILCIFSPVPLLMFYRRESQSRTTRRRST